MVFFEIGHFPRGVELPNLNKIYRASLAGGKITKGQIPLHRHYIARFVKVCWVNCGWHSFGREVAEECHKTRVAVVHFSGVEYLVARDVEHTVCIAAVQKRRDVSCAKIAKKLFYDLCVVNFGSWCLFFVAANCGQRKREKEKEC